MRYQFDENASHESELARLKAYVGDNSTDWANELPADQEKLQKLLTLRETPKEETKTDPIL